MDSTAADLYAGYAEHFCGEVSRELEEYADLATCLRADAARFAAHKAVYVEKVINEILNDPGTPQDQRQAEAEQAMRQFHQWSDTEAGYIAATSQMAAKWHDLEKDGDRYLLQYRTASDERVRDEHAVLHGITLPPSDPFWNEYYPPLGWNCRCTVVQVLRDKYPESDSQEAIEIAEQATVKTPSFRFNAGKQQKLFSDNVSYLKRVQGHKETHQLNKSEALERAKIIKEKRLIDFLGGERNLIVDKWGLKETAFKQFGNPNYILKNEIAAHIYELLPKMKYLREEDIDLTHNTGKVLKLKKKMSKVHKMEIYLRGTRFELTLLEYKNSGNLLFYCIRADK